MSSAVSPNVKELFLKNPTHLCEIEWDLMLDQMLKKHIDIKWQVSIHTGVVCYRLKDSSGEAHLPALVPVWGLI